MTRTDGLLTRLRQMPELTLETKGPRIDVCHQGRTLATVDPGVRLDMAVPPQFLPILLGKFPKARRTRNGLMVNLEDSSAVDAAASLVRMRIDEERYGWQFSESGP